jgi:sortase A
VGRIEIPAVGVSAWIVEGVGDDDLNHAVGRIPQTARFGEPGNVALAGHRDRHFRGLRNIAPGHEVIVTTRRGVFRYVVDQAGVVDPSRVDVIGNRDRDELTLVTCFPFDWIGPAPQRFVVHARAIDEHADETRAL